MNWCLKLSFCINSSHLGQMWNINEFICKQQLVVLWTTPIGRTTIEYDKIVRLNFDKHEFRLNSNRTYPNLTGTVMQSAPFASSRTSDNWNIFFTTHHHIADSHTSSDRLWSSESLNTNVFNAMNWTIKYELYASNVHTIIFLCFDSVSVISAAFA